MLISLFNWLYYKIRYLIRPNIYLPPVKWEDWDEENNCSTLSIAEGKLVADKFANTPIIPRGQGGTFQLRAFIYPPCPCRICGATDALWYDDPTAPLDEDFYPTDPENHPSTTSRCLAHLEPHLEYSRHNEKQLDKNL